MLKASYFKDHIRMLFTCHVVLLLCLFALLNEACKSRKKKHQMACEWKGKENPSCFKVCGLLKDPEDLWAERDLFCPNLQPSCKLSRRISLWCVLHWYIL